jgi:hypothetical protein
MHSIDDGLERLGKILLWTVLACAVLALLIEVLPHLTGGGIAETLKYLHPLAILLGAMAAGLPAFIAALGGIMFQSEARRLLIRSEAMYHGMIECEHAMRLQARAIAAAVPPGSAWHAAQDLRHIAAITVQETGDWKVLYQTHDLRAG